MENDRDHYQEWADEELLKDHEANPELFRENMRHAPISSGIDPKGEAGKKKCPLHLVPPVAMEEAAKAHALGAEKYGAWNWRENNVCASTYIGAMMRHLVAWRDGENIDPESRASHLGHIIAGCGILLDAAKHGTLVDDRPKGGQP